MPNNSYEYADYFLNLGLNYYKLTQTDFDGTTKDHGIRVIHVDNKGDFYLYFYPNPFDSEVFVSSNNVVSSIAVYSPEGRLVKIISNVNSSTYKLTTTDLSAGIYFIKIEDEFGKSYFKKIAKIVF